MAQRVPEESRSFDEVVRLVEKLAPDERARLLRRLEFQSWDDKLNQVKKQLESKHAAQGLPAPTDEDVHLEIDTHRSPEEWLELKLAVQVGIDQLDRGEGIPADEVFAELKERNKKFRKKD